MSNEVDFASMGAEIARAMGEGPSADRMLAQRARLVEWERQQGSATRLQARWFRGALVLASVCAVVFGLWIFTGSEPSSGPTATLTAQLDGRALAADTWVNAASGPAQLRFSEDSSIVLAEGASARVASIGSDGLNMTLEKGSLRADITPGGEYQWLVHAGPYRVRVVGTVFDVRWRPDAAQLRVSVTRGKVQVSGGAAGEHERELVAGDSLTLSIPGEDPDVRGAIEAVRDTDEPRAMEPAESDPAAGGVDGRQTEDDSSDDSSEHEEPRLSQRQPFVKAPQVTSGSNASEQHARPRQQAVDVETAEPDDDSKDESPGVRAPTSPSSGEWKRLAKDGPYPEAVAAARREGISGLLGSSSASDLLLLADAARLGGDVGLAKRALLELRKRFPSHSNAAVAAFSLGRLEAEQRGDQRAAIKWFRKYLASGASGALAEAARGRLLTAYMSLGEHDSARKAANDYLKHHPNGARATLARSLLD